MQSQLTQCYEADKENLYKELQEVEFVVIITDFWTSRNTKSYITVSCHFLDKLGEMKSYILSTYQVKMDHTGDNIASELRKVADELGISEKVSCVVTDNASNIIGATRLTGWKNLPYMAHTLNLIVQERVY